MYVISVFFSVFVCVFLFPHFVYENNLARNTIAMCFCRYPHMRAHTCTHTLASWVLLILYWNITLASCWALTHLQGKAKAWWIWPLEIKRATSRFRQFIPFVSNRKGLSEVPVSLSHTLERTTLRLKGQWLARKFWAAQQPVLDKLPGHVGRSRLPIPRCLHADKPVASGWWKLPICQQATMSSSFLVWEQHDSHKKFQRQKPVLLSF